MQIEIIRHEPEMHDNNLTPLEEIKYMFHLKKKNYVITLFQHPRLSTCIGPNTAPPNTNQVLIFLRKSKLYDVEFINIT